MLSFWPMGRGGDGWVGMRATKRSCTQNGALIFGSRFKIRFSPRGIFLVLVLGGWVGGLAWGGGVRQITPPPCPPPPSRG